MAVRFLIYLCLSCFALSGFAKPDYRQLGAVLYPQQVEEQAVIRKFFEIVEAHKTQDPFFEGPGPSIREYSFDKIKFALITNVTEKTVDLVFFHWTLPLVTGMTLDPNLSAIYGSTVYWLKGVDRKSISSQGENHDQLSIFSYLLGSNFIEKQIRLSMSSQQEVPEAVVNWKPHADYMDRSAPLRKVLDSQLLVLLSPSEDVFLSGLGIPKRSQEAVKKAFAENGGVPHMILSTIVHEAYHAKEGEDQTNKLIAKRLIEEDRPKLIEELQNQKTRDLIATYIRIVFSLADDLKSAPVPAREREHLTDLRSVIAELKTRCPEFWKFLWGYEYTEGFAEYVAAYSMIQVGVMTLPQKIDLEKSDDGNNFTYRTGTFAGLYLANRLRVMPFQNQEDHRESPWEIIIRLAKVESGPRSIDQVIEKYKNLSDVNTEAELKLVTDYFESTAFKPKQN